MCENILSSEYITIRDVARLSGKFSSSFIGVPTGKLHFRYLERDKTSELVRRKGKYDKRMFLSEEAKAEISWWRDNISSSWSPIQRDNPSMVLTTDASLLGWGATFDHGAQTG